MDVEVGAGQSVMAAAEDQGIFWPTVCHGLAECHTCFFEVVSGEEHLEPPNPLEEAALPGSPAVRGTRERSSVWPVRPGCVDR